MKYKVGSYYSGYILEHTVQIVYIAQAFCKLADKKLYYKFNILLVNKNLNGIVCSEDAPFTKSFVEIEDLSIFNLLYR